VRLQCLITKRNSPNWQSKDVWKFRSVEKNAWTSATCLKTACTAVHAVADFSAQLVLQLFGYISRYLMVIVDIIVDIPISSNLKIFQEPTVTKNWLTSHQMSLSNLPHPQGMIENDIPQKLVIWVRQCHVGMVNIPPIKMVMTGGWCK